jgi:hypothetical protein
VADAVERGMPLVDEISRGRLRPEQLAGDLVGRRPGAVRLDVTAPGAVAGARFAVGDDHHVPELGPSAVQRAVDDDAAADAGPEREHDEGVHVATCPEPEFGVRGRVGVVVDADRHLEAFFHLVTEADLGDRDVHGAHHDARPLVDACGHAEAHSSDLGHRQAGDELGNLVQQRRLGRVVRGALDRLVDVPLLVDDARQHLGPADVDTDDAICLHERWVP